MLNRHVLESAIEIVNLCIEARDKQLDLENYYCDFARVKYRQFNDIVTIDSSAVEKIKSDNAYELMVLDLNGRLKNLEYSEMRRKLPKDNFGKQLNLLLQDAVIYLFLFIYILLMIGLLVLFNTKSHNKQGYMLEKPPHINKY
ncbi:hypothetical protein CRG86_015625 [Photobacterium leiognathi]|nr:hypothetical protein CRG86_015625 [Photobacterium leiognathi]